MLKIEKIKDEIKNYDMVNSGEDLQCYLSQITTNQNYDDTCYRIGIDCSDCLKLSLMDLLEEYKEPVKLTKFEYEYLKVAKRERFNFIAKDGDGRLFLYKNKPFKSLDEWIVASKDCCRILDSLFKFVKLEDEEPWNIDNILANCEVMQDDI
ncbi:hypothetical protein [Thomasclavelia ramosa]|uniref:hypothetical protein n=1 Tax=Thomasclavelia ramosa TaxID=1547 RepID=UPI00233E90E6|nr:hypothetical protein [Thomasclavelia ramosa]MDC2833756.1 hypothetical protein [Thomasclavelia ramosa]